MSDINYAEWAVIILFFGLMCASSFVLGGGLAQAILRVRSQGERPAYRKWGVDADIFRPNSTLWFIVGSVAVVFGILFTFSFAFLSTVLITEDASPITDRFQYTLSIATYALFIGFAIELQRIENIEKRIKTLTDLREVFQQRFKVSELISMYENLRPAPSLFWEEYANLPDEEINQETNRSYRERAAPYSHSQSNRYNRIATIVGIGTLLLGVVVAVKELLP